MMFDPAEGPTGGRPGPVSLVLVFLAGAALWLGFLDFGDLPFGILDWRSSWFYCSILKEAAERGVVPLHMSEPYFTTVRFLALPNAIVAPHVILLRWLSIPQFLVVHIMLLYTIGYLGSVVFVRRYGLTWPGFLFFWLVFNLNGYVTAHFGVGHGTWWTGYFLLPWFFLGVLEWVEREPSVRVCIDLALVIFGMSLLGSFHLCNWCLIFLALLSFRRSGWMLYGALTGSLVIALCLYRLMPAAVTFEHLRFVGPAGYPGISVLVKAFVSVELITHRTINTLGWWEYDIYVSLVGVAGLVVFGAAPLFMRGKYPTPVFPLRRLDLPLAGMALLPVGEVYFWVLTSVPVAGAERVVTRLMVMPVVLLAMLAAIRLKVLAGTISASRALSWLTAGLGLLLAVSLLRHWWVWRPEALAGLLPRPLFPPGTPAIASNPDPGYVTAVARGAVLSLLALAGAVGWRVRAAHRAPVV